MVSTFIGKKEKENGVGGDWGGYGAWGTSEGFNIIIRADKSD